MYDESTIKFHCGWRFDDLLVNINIWGVAILDHLVYKYQQFLDGSFSRSYWGAATSQVLNTEHRLIGVRFSIYALDSVQFDSYMRIIS